MTMPCSKLRCIRRKSGLLPLKSHPFTMQGAAATFSATAPAMLPSGVRPPLPPRRTLMTQRGLSWACLSDSWGLWKILRQPLHLSLTLDEEAEVGWGFGEDCMMALKQSYHLLIDGAERKKLVYLRQYLHLFGIKCQ